MTNEEIAAVFDRLSPDEREFLRQLTYFGRAGEARAFVELYHHFPGTTMEGALRNGRSVVQDLPPYEPRMFVRDDPQRAWEAWV